MKLVKLKEVVVTLEKLKEDYEDLRLLIADQIRDNQIAEAKNNFERLESLGLSIDQMEDINVQI